MQFARRKRLAQAGAAAIEQMRRAAWPYDQWLVMAEASNGNAQAISHPRWLQMSTTINGHCGERKISRFRAMRKLEIRCEI
jgi:hypothetical protein